jgi:transposase
MSKQPDLDANNGVNGSTMPSSEVRPPGEWRTRSVAEKLRILQEYDAFPLGSPERGALLRREGIYTSHISKWRKRLRHQGVTGLQPQPRGPQAATPAALRAELNRLRKENVRLQARLAQAETIIDVQKKLSQLLGIPLPPHPDDA